MHQVKDVGTCRQCASGKGSGDSVYQVKGLGTC